MVLDSLHNHILPVPETPPRFPHPRCFSWLLIGMHPFLSNSSTYFHIISDLLDQNCMLLCVCACVHTCADTGMYKCMLPECNAILADEGCICAFSLQYGKEQRPLAQVLPLLCFFWWSKEPKGPNGHISPHRPCTGYQDLKIHVRSMLSSLQRLCKLSLVGLPSAPHAPWWYAAFSISGSRWTRDVHCPHASDREWRKKWERRQGRSWEPTNPELHLDPPGC